MGAGAEVRLAGNWTGKVEYLYLDFGRVATAATNPLNATPLAVNFDSHVTNHVARVGLNYKFDPTGAVYAPAADARTPLLLKAPMLAAWPIAFGPWARSQPRGSVCCRGSGATWPTHPRVHGRATSGPGCGR